MGCRLFGALGSAPDDSCLSAVYQSSRNAAPHYQRRATRDDAYSSSRKGTRCLSLSTPVSPPSRANRSSQVLHLLSRLAKSGTTQPSGSSRAAAPGGDSSARSIAVRTALRCARTASRSGSRSGNGRDSNSFRRPAKATEDGIPAVERRKAESRRALRTACSSKMARSVVLAKWSHPLTVRARQPQIA
jgi:hypothetical protein